MHVVLRPIHVMMGCDLHNERTPVGAEVPLTPHLVGDLLKGRSLPMTKMTGPTVTALHTEIMLRDTDIANGINHIPLIPGAFVLAPLLSALSGSKSYFGPSSVVAKGNPIACAFETYIGRNLNCADPCSAPFNYVVAWGTVVCGMTVGDIIGAVVAMAIDMLISAAVGLLGGSVAKAYADALVGNVVSALAGWCLQQKSLPGKELYAPQVGNIGDLGALGGHALGEEIDKLRGKTSPSQASLMLASPFPTPPASAATKAIYEDPEVEDL